MIIPYTKPSTSVSEQIQLLQSRGLQFKDVPAATHFLRHIGYYRLAGYWRVFEQDTRTHIFTPGTTFEQVMELYNFDRQLRLLLLDAIERIEVSMRAVIIDTMCEGHGPFWYHDHSLFFDSSDTEELLITIDRELKRSDEPFIKHHEQKYGSDTYPPAWKTIQILSFGTLSKLYGNIRRDVAEKKAIARVYALPNGGYLHSWIQALCVLRNHCAHHNRISYRRFSFPPKQMNRGINPWIHWQQGADNQQLYAQICAVKYLLDIASPGSQFTIKLKRLFKKYETVEPGRMGFGEGWESEPLWDADKKS